MAGQPVQSCFSLTSLTFDPDNEEIPPDGVEMLTEYDNSVIKLEIQFN